MHYYEVGCVYWATIFDSSDIMWDWDYLQQLNSSRGHVTAGCNPLHLIELLINGNCLLLKGETRWTFTTEEKLKRWTSMLSARTVRKKQRT